MPPSTDRSWITRSVWAGLATASVVAGLSGCASTALAALPDDVTVNVKQYRSDIQPRRLQVQVTNRSSEPITITSAAFRSEWFAGDAEWKKESSVVPAGLTRDLPVSLGNASCNGADALPEVTLDFELDDGRSGTATVEPTDTLDDLSRVHADDCLYEDIQRTARLSVGALEVTGSSAASVAHLAIDVAPTGVDSSYRIVEVGTTVLLQSATGGSWPIGLDVLGTSAPSGFVLDIVPNRCDAHAIAEDKVGTLLPVAVETAAGAGRFTLPLDDATRLGLLAFVAQHCGLDR